MPPFSNKNPNQISEADLVALIGAETESKFLDYKRDIVGNGDGDRKEFLYDISSFANTQGGYLVFGIEEAKGLPTRIVGLAACRTKSLQLVFETGLPALRRRSAPC